MSSPWRTPWVTPICANRSEWVAAVVADITMCRRRPDRGRASRASVRAPVEIYDFQHTLSRTGVRGARQGLATLSTLAILVWLGWGGRGNGRKNSEKTPGSPPRTSSPRVPPPCVGPPFVRPHRSPFVRARGPLRPPFVLGQAPLHGSPHPVQSLAGRLRADSLPVAGPALPLLGGMMGGVCARWGLVLLTGGS